MSFKSLIVYQKAFELAMRIFELSKSFPEVEKFALTNQIVRSSRAVCAAVSEGYRKRQYEKHFISKLSDADSENSETQLWLDFALACKYITEEENQELSNQSNPLFIMMNSICPKTSVRVIFCKKNCIENTSMNQNSYSRYEFHSLDS